MKIDPNFSVELERECVLCDGGTVVLWNGKVVSAQELDGADNPFAEFCRSLDPNRCFIGACVPEDIDRPTFFKARDAARRLGLHMQASVDTPERHREQWKYYCESRRARASASPNPDRSSSQKSTAP